MQQHANGHRDPSGEHPHEHEHSRHQRKGNDCRACYLESESRRTRPARYAGTGRLCGTPRDQWLMAQGRHHWWVW